MRKLFRSHFSVLVLVATIVGGTGVFTSTWGLLRLDAIQKLPGSGGQRISWVSETTAVYQVERNLDLRTTNWVVVSTNPIIANSTQTSFDDTNSAPYQAFWRVVRIGGADSEPPVVGGISARLVESNNQIYVQLSVSADDTLGVTGISFFNGTNILGSATLGAGGVWTLNLLFTGGTTNLLELRAVAQDAAGNSGFSAIFGLRTAQPYVPGMRALGPNGPTPLNLLSEKSDGSLNPFSYIPANHAGGSVDRALRFDFVSGARLVAQGTNRVFSFTNAIVRFGPRSPLGFDPAAVPMLSGGVPGFSLNFPSNAPASLTAGNLNVAALKQLLGIPATSNIPLMLFGKFPIQWVGGVLTEEGIVGGRFRLPNLGFPLPDLTGDYADAVFNLFTGEDAEFPIVGEWDIPGAGAKLKSAKAKPLTLTLRPDGTFALRGPVELIFNNGVRLTATLRLDDPIYSLTLEASQITIPLVTLLGTILPSNPEACIGAGFDDAQLDAMRECVRAHDKAYKAFVQAALALRPDTPADQAIVNPPGVQDLVAASLEAAAASIGIFAASGSGFPIQSVRDFVNGWWAPSSAEPDDLLAAFENVLASERYLKALEQLRAVNPADTNAIAAQNEMIAVLQSAKTALVAIAQSDAASSSLARLNEITSLLADYEALAVSNEVAQAIQHVLTAYVGKMAARYGIQSNVFDFAANPLVSGLRYEECLELIASLQDAFAAANKAGLSADAISRYPELRSQLLRRAGSRITARLDESLPNGDVYASVLAIADLGDFLHAVAVLGMTGQPGLPTVATLTGYADELSFILNNSLLGDGPPVRELLRRAAALDAAVRAFEASNPTSNFSENARRRIHALLTEKLPPAAIEASAGLMDAELVLRAGIAHAKIGRSTSGTSTNYNWETAGLDLVADAWAAAIATNRAWGQFPTLMRALLDEAEALEREAVAITNNPALALERAISRKRYLRVASEALAAARPSILGFWAETQQLRASQNSTNLADGALPGDLQLDRLRGSVTYNRTNHFLGGTFKGRLIFPAEDLFLEIVSASIDNTGAFSINAATQVPLEPFGNPNIRLNATILANGTSNGLQSVSGGGDMFVGVPNTSGSGFTTQRFGVAYSYAPGEPGKPLKIQSTNAVEQAPLDFSPDFVIFNLAWSAEWKQGAAGGFTLKSQGLAGLYARKPRSIPTNRDTDFWSVVEINQMTLAFDAQKARAEFTGGELELPSDIFVKTDELGNPLTNQRTRVTMAGTLRVDVPYTNPTPRFSSGAGSNQPFVVTFQNFRFSVPGMPQSRITVATAALHFAQTEFPFFNQLNAELRFPLPGMNAANTNQHRLLALNVAGEDWRVDGFPKLASIALAQPLDIVALDGMKLILIPQSQGGSCGTQFKIERVPPTGAVARARLTLDGSMKAVFATNLLANADAPGAALESAQVCGTFVWDFVDLPTFDIPVIQIVGRVSLGGPQGVRIVGPGGVGGATLTLNGLLHVFNLSPANPFSVDFTGALDLAEFVTFSLLNAGLKWDGSSLVPAVSLGGIQTDLGSQAIELAENLPIFPTQIGAQFKNPALPVFPSAGQTGLLDVANIQLIVGAVANIPDPISIQSGAPGFSGAIEGMTVGVRRDGNLFVPEISLNGLKLSVSGLDIPPLGGLGGGLYVGNIQDPTNIFFAGSLQGSAYDAGAKVTMAIHRRLGLLGAAFDVDVGPAGIPLDGGALGGILLTGGGGGLSFGNRFAQPTDFLNSFSMETVNGEKRPVNNGNTAEFPDTGDPAPVDYGTVPPASDDPAGCIRGPFPPPTINPLAEVHPSNTNRIIFKGTALNESQVNALGITPGSVPPTLNAAVSFASGKLIQPVSNLVSTLLAAVPAAVPSNTKSFYSGILYRQLSQARSTVENILAGALANALAVNTNANLYNVIVAAAAEGIPALDATLRVQGNFSHAAVSTVLKGKGGVTVSTTGTAALDGEVTLVGLPIGTGILAFSLTDSLGAINPAFGGVVSAGLGPLKLGNMSMAYQCDACFEGVLNAFETFLATNVAVFNAETRSFLVEVMNRTVPVNPARSLTGNPLTFFQQLNPGQKLAFIAGIFNVVDMAAAGTPLPGLSPAATATFAASLGQYIANVLIAVNPRLCFEAKVKPTLFGFPLVPGPTPLDAAFAYERISDIGGEFQQLSANAEFSPAFLLATLTMGPGGALTPASDKVNFGYSFRVPAFTPQTASFALTNPVAFAANQFTAFVQDSVMTFGYAFMPLGVPMADGQMRIIMPRLLNHPTNPNRVINPLYPTGPANAWIPPSGPGIAKSDDVILAALVRGKLSDATWRGAAGDLDDLFVFGAPPAPGSPEARIAAIGATLDLNKMDQLEFAADYFPYGGFIGASQLEFPSVFVQAPPFDLFGRVLLPDFGNLGAWVADAQNLFENYLAASSDIGQMAVYLPAPNPPFGFDFSTNTARDLIEAVSSANVFAILNRAAPQGLYPFEAVLLAGYAKAQFLGLPLGEATVRLDGSTGTFLANAQIPNDSWLTYFVTSSVNLVIRKPAFMNATPPAATNLTQLYDNTPVGTVAERLTNLAAVVAGFSTASPPSQAVADTIRQTLADTLPKVSMEAAASVQIPNELRGFMRGGASATVFAFSPAFDPTFEPANHSPYALAKRRGGVGVRGSFEFGYFPTNVPANQHFAINVPDASFFLGLDGGVGVFPAFAGQVQVGQILIPGGARFTNGLLTVSTSPDNLAPYFGVAGSMTPFVWSLGPVELFRMRALNGGQNLSGDLTVYRNDADPTKLGVGLKVGAAQALAPFLGTGVALIVHGGFTNGQYQPFSFSTAPGQSWSAQMALAAPGNPSAAPVFSITDPFSPGGSNRLMTFTPSGPLAGSITGTGTNYFRAQFTVPTGFEVVFYPDSAHESRVATPPGTNMLFIFDSQGRLYCNLGSLPNIRLPGLISASAKIEFGYNPDDPQAAVRLYNSGGTSLTSPISFGSLNLVNSTAVTIRVKNEGTQSANIGISITQTGQVSDFTASVDGFQVEPGSERSVALVFQPKATGTRTATLRIASNDPDFPLQIFTLSGSGFAEPIYVQSRPNVPFGDTLVGASSESTLTIGNAGSSNMVLTAASVSGAGFSVTPTGGVTLAPGASRTFTVTFTPSALGAATGALNLSLNAPIGNKTIPLSGNGSESRWYTVLDSELAGNTAQLNAIRMLDAAEGFVVGNNGTFLQTRDGGRSWWPRDITRQSLTAIAVDKGDITLPAAAIYHLDEPPGTLSLLDASGNNRHGTMANGGPMQRPLRSFTYGRFGSGLDFDGTDDFAQIGTFAMPLNFSIAMWVKFGANADNQALITKNGTTGSSQFRFGKYSGGYQVRISPFNVTTPAVPPLNTWIHLIVTGTRAVGAVTTTTVRIYQDNSLIGTHVVTGEVTQSISNPWMIGARMIGSNLTQVADFFNGAMDEVMIFDGVLTAEQRANLFKLNRNRMVVTANNGQVFESYNRGSLWSQLPDLNAFGWRNRTKTFQTIGWNGAEFGSTNAGGPLYLVGTRVSGSFFRHVMVEDLHPGEDGIDDTADDEFDAVAFSNAPAGAFPIMMDIAHVGTSMRVVGNDGVIFSQNQSAGLGSAFVGSSTNAGPALAAIEQHSAAGGFVAVGITGRILRANGASTSVVASGTSETLNDVVFRDDIAPSYHAVGLNGVYLTSANTGVNWQVVQDGLAGNLFGFDAVRVPGGSATQYHAWAVGGNHSIQYRPPQQVTGSFMNFHPGKLDFGFVLSGESQTRTIRIRNRGKQPLQISSMVFAGPAAGRFSIGQSNLGFVPLDGAMDLDIRYRPTDASSLDAAELVVTCNDPQQPTFRIPLEGRSGTRDWIPATLQNGGQPVTGSVVRVRFTSATRGYALVAESNAASVLYRTDNGGETWTRSTFPAAGGIVKLTGMDFARPDGGSFDVGLVCGHVEDASSNFIKGIVFRTVVPTTSNPTPTWTDVTPIPAGTNIQPLRVVSVALTDTFLFASTNNLRAVLSTGGNSAQANVWGSTNSGIAWFTPTNRPSATFNGGPVATRAVLMPIFVPVFAASGASLFSRTNVLAHWPASPQEVVAPGVIRDMHFMQSAAIGADFDQGWAVGDSGTFLLWNPNQATVGDWYPPKDAERFGTINLAGVHSRNLNDVWVVGESKIFDSRDQGVTWKLSYDAGSAATLTCVSSMDADNAWVGGSLDGKATVWRYIPPPSPNTRVLQTIDYRDWGTLQPGLSSAQTITLINQGTNNLPIHEIVVEADEPRTRFRITSDAPTNIAAGASSNLTVTFDSFDEPSLAEQLKPAFFHRFEQEWDAALYLDDSTNARNANAASLPATNRPALALSSFRDRCLRFDGNDRVEINEASGPDTIPTNYAVSIWAAPDSISGTRILLAKDDASGGDLFQLAMVSTGYQIRIRGSTVVAGGAPPLEWQHLAVNFVHSGSVTRVSLYRDGGLLFEATLAAQLGSAPGTPWTLGGEYVSASATSNHFLGALDDASLFLRALTEGEIQRLASKSPLYGEHRARLVINSGSERAVREVALRALVAPAPRFVRFETEPAGLPVTIDGVTYTAPVGFTVVPYASAAAGAREWVEGSEHRISVASTATLAHVGGSVSYRFSEWSSAPAREFAVTASRTMTNVFVATFAPVSVSAPPIGDPPARTNGPDPLISGLAGAPKGPFLRITDGNLTLPNLAGNNFQVSGELFVSLTKVNGHLNSTGISLPPTGTVKFAQIGSAKWKIEAEAGGAFLFEAMPPSLNVLGYDVLPDGLTRLSYNPTTPTNAAQWALLFNLRRDFKPYPDMLEFKKGLVELRWLATNNPPAFTLDLNGGLRLLRLPNNSFAFDQTMRVRLDTVNFNVSVSNLLASAGLPQPANLFQAEPFRIGWGDVRLRRVSGGPVFLELVNLPFVFNSNMVATVNGSINTEGTLELTGSIGQNGIVRVDPNGRFLLRKIGSGSASFSAEISPRRLAFETPPLRLESTATSANGTVLTGVSMPGIRFDSSGEFDTGKLKLPSFSFDGIAIDGPSDGKRADNYIRLRRESGNRVIFTTKCEQTFLTCRANLVLRIKVTGNNLPVLSGSMSGNFCVLPEEISLNYSPSSSCQFNGSAFGFTVEYGSTCAGVTW